MNVCTYFYLPLRLNVQGNVPEGRSWHGMAVCSDRHLMIYGGFTTNREALGESLCKMEQCQIVAPFYLGERVGLCGSIKHE